jgi:hypothetical protein
VSPWNENVGDPKVCPALPPDNNAFFKNNRFVTVGKTRVAFRHFDPWDDRP